MNGEGVFRFSLKVESNVWNLLSTKVTVIDDDCGCDDDDDDDDNDCGCDDDFFWNMKFR